ncbi:MAG: MotA/TolQ/ExbB proton channel family protein [Bacteroidales bacterium]|jgi:biopolymer transport protein ExbB|nr:MotA/TolQ/ExbB proton channel family protein [Bacteroidales bacterium]MCI2121302.1 MotA/TolQ/ExbB proton channel family protein [Bacteroidales bacterium]MCI2145208.1 MotA/TolQ/ExbB proton channel family protein [Bacteroidales bacterium]
MKKIFMFLAVVGLMAVSAQIASAQDDTAVTAQQPATEQVAPAAAEQPEAATKDVPLHQSLKKTFIDGGPGFMSTILLCLIFGLAIAIERIISLNLAQGNKKKLVEAAENYVKNGKLKEGAEYFKTKRGPVASIIEQAFLRKIDGQSIEEIEKAISSYGAVEMGGLESGLSWITLFISIAPMLGFMGTVIGLIQAFSAIQIAGDISPTLVAAGMKVALITTVGGLVVAIILQILYNYLISKVDSIVIDMEDSSVSLIDMLVKYAK